MTTIIVARPHHPYVRSIAMKLAQWFHDDNGGEIDHHDVFEESANTSPQLILTEDWKRWQNDLRALDVECIAKGERWNIVKGYYTDKEYGDRFVVFGTASDAATEITLWDADEEQAALEQYELTYWKKD